MTELNYKFFKYDLISKIDLGRPYNQPNIQCEVIFEKHVAKRLYFSHSQTFGTNHFSKLANG